MAHLACVHGLIDYLHVLKEHRANLELATADGIRPAHEAVVNLQIDCLQYLLVQVHCPVNTKDNNGATLLHYAADKGSIELCHFLLESGAEVNSVLSHKGRGGKSCVYYTPADFARMKGHEDVVSHLERAGGKKGDDIADRASRKIQKLMRRRVAENRRKRELAGTGTDTDLVSTASETAVDRDLEKLGLDTSTDDDTSRSALSPFHVPTPLRERRYVPGLHMISLATPPLRFTPAPEPSPLPALPISPTTLSPQEQLNARSVSA